MARTELRPGDAFGPYRVENELGAGGFATVYRALNTETGTHVALKVLRPDGADYSPATRGRLQREIDALSRISTPHVVRLLDHGEVDGTLFMAFELVDGEDLSAVLKRRERFSIPEATTILRQLLVALDHAHLAGVLHRDIKPENVRIADERTLRAVLLDFGIARPSDNGSPGLTATGELVGTPRYMSPEQLTGRPLGPSSDIYSLGMLTLELVLGRGALQGNSWGAQLDRLRSGYVFPVAEADETGLLQIVARMTARLVDDRYASARAVLRDLDGPEPVAAPAATRPNANKQLIALAVVLLTVILVSGAFVANKLTTSELPDRPPQQRSNPFANRTPKEAVVAPADPVPVVEADSDCPSWPFRGRDTLYRDDLPIYVPTTATDGHRLPLVIVLHDNGMRGADLLGAGGLADLAEKHGFVVLAPEDGLAAVWEPEDEVPAKMREIHKLADEFLCLDPARTFVIGQGEGAKAARTLSCEPWVTAFATNANAMEKKKFWCEPAGPKPFMMVLSARYGDTPPDGGETCSGKSTRLPYDVQEKLWKRRNKIDGGATTENLPGGHMCRNWQGEAALRVCITDGGGTWPGTTAARFMSKGNTCPNPPNDFPIGEQIWSFFAEQEGR